MQSTRLGDLFLQRRDQVLGQDCHPVPAAFAVSNQDFATRELHVLDPDAQTLDQPPPRAVEQRAHQADAAIHLRKHSADFRHRQDGFTNRLRSIPESLRKTLTYDQGSEMALHKTLSQRLRLDVYFCDAHSPWQRGSNENANGLIREYLPKGTDLSVYSHQALSAIEQSLNNRPRKILGYRTLAEVFEEIKLHGLQGVALQA